MTSPPRRRFTTVIASRIYNFAFRFLKNSEAAEDATQEVFVKMLKHANQFHGDAKLSTWLFSITANWCRDYLRKADNRAKEAEDVLISLPAPAELSPDRNLERREDEQRIQKALTAADAGSARSDSPLALSGAVVCRDRADLRLLRGSGEDESVPRHGNAEESAHRRCPRR